MRERSMKNLTTYVDKINSWNRITKAPLVDVNNIDQEVADGIFDSLDFDLSPENLHCDGEISATAARRKAKLFYGAGDELLKLGFKPSNEWSEFAS